LLKNDDAYAGGEEPTERFPESILSGLTVEELREGPARLAQLRARLRALRAPARRVDAATQPVMLATLGAQPFSRPGWLFEVKYDGVRVLAARDGGAVELWAAPDSGSPTAIRKSWPRCARLPLERFVLDGEVVALDERGRPSFQRLQARMHLTRPADVLGARASTPVTGVFFDALALDGRDLRRPPARGTKRLLGAGGSRPRRDPRDRARARAR
jgi:bifunctional non-homologous end joining protein LigD